MKTNAKTSPNSRETPQPNRLFSAAKKLLRYKFGSLWWGRDDLIQKKQPTFVKRENRIGHPLVSVKRDELASRSDCIPMLVGTSGWSLRTETRNACVQILGLRQDDPEHVTFFGTIIKPGLYGFDDLMDGVKRKRQIFRCLGKTDRYSPEEDFLPAPWYECRVMYPNQDKPWVDDGESFALEQFCKKHGF